MIECKIVSKIKFESKDEKSTKLRTSLGKAQESTKIYVENIKNKY